MTVPSKSSPSALYLKCLSEAQAHHAASKTYSGKFLRPHAPLIKAHIEQLGGASSILDYGCGKGVQYEWVSHGDEASIPEGMTIEQFWGTRVKRFDPAWPPFSIELPAGQKFDVVICTHVLGSIPISDLRWVLRELFDRANRLVYIAEKIGEVRKKVFSVDDLSHRMPRFDPARWRSFIGEIFNEWRREHLLEHDGDHDLLPKVWLVTRERRPEGAIMLGDWI